MIVCPRCGWQSEEGVPYCPQCGTSLGKPTTAQTVWLIVSILLLVFVGLPALALGGCYLLMSTFSGTDMTKVLLGAAGLLVVFVGTVWFFIYRIKRMK